MNKTGLNQYQKIETEGASPAQVISLLLEKCAKETEKAKKCIQNQESEKIMDHAQNISTILIGLSNCLVRETPEQQEMAQILSEYYGMLLKLVNQIVCQQDVISCDALISSVRSMAGTWRQGEQASIPSSSAEIPNINYGV